MTDMCGICDKLSSILRGETFHHEIVPLCSRLEYEEQANVCQTCRDVMVHMKHQDVFNVWWKGSRTHTFVHLTSMATFWSLSLSYSHEDYVHGTERNPESYFLRFRRGGRTTNWQGLRVRSKGRSNTNEVPSAFVNPDHVDYDMVKRWLAHCEQHHSGECHSIRDPWKRLEAAMDLLLVDVDQERLVRVVEPPSYLALSYVWGQEARPLRTCRSNIDELVAPGSLAPGSPLGRRLPRTLRDAMTVTKRLGLSHLWIDRLCIVQDDEENMRHAIASMASIYANSLITIIASEGDDANGLPGVSSPASSTTRESPTRLRWTRQTLSLPHGVELVLDPDLGALNDLSANYLRRGWTMQEQRLSTRTLRLTSWGAIWSCRRIYFDESQDDEKARSVEVKDPFHDGPIPMTLYGRHPNEFGYSLDVEAYCRRLLTRQEDVINAFSALMYVTGRAMPGGVFYGLPEMRIDGMLLWQPCVPLQRRMSDTTGEALDLVPSWSFLAWQGVIDMGIWRDLLEGSFWRILRCVQYFKVDRRTGLRTALARQYYEGGTKVQPKTEDPAAPMSRRAGFDFGCREPKWALNRDVPTHEQVVAPASKWHPVLELRTRHARCRTGGVIADAWDEYKDTRKTYGLCLDVSLVSQHEEEKNADENAHIVGSIRTNVSNVAEAPCWETIELICLSKGRWDELPEAAGPFGREASACIEQTVWHRDCPPYHDGGTPESVGCKVDPKTRDFYNVMWIGWDGKGTAYRKGVGRVLASYWDEELETEEIDVRLG